MKQRVVFGVLSLACAALVVISVLVYMGQDREAPVINVEEKDITYTEGDDTSVLLEGVTAEDNRDGNITDQIFIDQIVETSNTGDGEAGKAIVKYAVLDEAKNVGTASRSITYIPNADGAAVQADSQDVQNEETADEAGTDEQQPEEVKEELVPNGVSPAIRLTSDTVTIAVGTEFDTMSVIEGAVDDVDSWEYLYNNMHLEGEYNTTVPGSYVLQYYALDSDGNQSNVETLTLVVQ